jgi:RTX calcium-binding nonapeptide repeat (4 copies)
MRRTVLVLFSMAVALLLASGALAATNVGYRDFSFAASGVGGAATPMMAQSKLWFNDGLWWGVLFDRSSEEYRIYRYEWPSHSWNDTGTLVDERNFSKADALWDGDHLYIVSAGPNSTNSAHSARVSRYSYNVATRSYALDAGFPVTVTNGGMKTIVLDKDTTGKLWVSYTQQNRLYVNRSVGGDSSWSKPFVPPVKGTSVTPDDISAVVAYDLRTAAPKIGVMWSNQADDAMYFASHTDGQPDEAWQESRAAIQGPKQADDHINLKALPAGDSSGRVFAAVKTSLDDLPTPNPNAPQIMLLVLEQDGEWTSHVFGTVGDHHSRPIVMLDEEHRELYMFATAPTGGGTIYYKRTDLDSISFPSGKGTPFIQSATDTHIDDATSSKQNLRSATGLAVLASDSESKYYLHNAVDLGGGVPPSPPPTSCTILGTSANETISGTSADDVICAGGGNDTVNGLGGNDTLLGEGDNDTLLGGVGNDTLDGAAGTDTASYSASLTAVTASLATNSSTGEGSDTFLGVENLLGSSKADTLTGSAANNKLTGGGGADTEQGGLGNDQVIGSGGADTLKGGDGDDAVNSKDGKNGNDSLDGGGGTDTKVTDTTEKSIVNFP